MGVILNMDRILQCKRLLAAALREGQAGNGVGEMKLVTEAEVDHPTGWRNEATVRLFLEDGKWCCEIGMSSHNWSVKRTGETMESAVAQAFWAATDAYGMDY